MPGPTLGSMPGPTLGSMLVLAALGSGACTDDGGGGRSAGPAATVTATDATSGATAAADAGSDPGETESETEAVQTSSDSSGGPGPQTPARPSEPLSEVCFETQPSIAWSGLTPRWLVDVTGDGRADAITVVGSGGATVVSVFEGRGGPQPWTTSVDSTLEMPGDLQVADIDGDGRMDILGLGPELVTFAGGGDGTLEALPTTTSLSDYQSVAVLDFDSDGRADLLLTTFASELESHRGRGDGSFERIASTALADELPGTRLFAGRSGTLAAGVMMGAAAGCLECSESAFSVLAVEGSGAVVPLGGLQFSAMWKLISPTVGSVYASARPEVFVDFGVEQRTVFSVGDGELVTAGYLPNGPVGFGDLNADGSAELVLLDERGDLRVYADGPRDVRAVLTAQVGAAPELAVADVDADRWADAVLIDPVGFDPETGALQPTLTVVLTRPCEA